MNRTILLLGGIGVALLATSVFAQPPTPQPNVPPRPNPPGTPGANPTQTVPQVIVYGGFRDLGNPMTFETGTTYRFRLDDPGTTAADESLISQQFEAIGFSNVDVVDPTTLDDTWPAIVRTNISPRTSFVSGVWNRPTQSVNRISLITYAWEV